MRTKQHEKEKPLCMYCTVLCVCVMQADLSEEPVTTPFCPA